MLRASATDPNGRRTLIFGLEPGNIERLQKGQPISFNAKALGVDCDIVIFTGPSIAAMQEELGVAISNAVPEGTA